MIPAKPRIEPRDVVRVLVAVLLVLFLAAGLVAMNLLVLTKMARGGEFLTLWSGARAFLFEHASPYSTYVPEYVQRIIYARSAGPGENPFILDVPFSLLLLFFPLSIFQNATTALVIFQILLELTVLWYVMASIRLANWNPKIDLLFIFFVFTGLNYFTVQSLLEGSLSIFVIAGIAGLLLSLRTGRYELAGALVALLSTKWQLTAPILIFIILRVIRFRMWRVVAGFVMLTFVLTIISYFLYPGWILPYLRALVNDMRVEYGYSTFTIFEGLFQLRDTRITWFVTLIITILVIYEWTKAQDANDLQLSWTSCLTLAITPLLGLRFEIQDLSLLLLPTALILAVVSERWARTGRWIATILMITFLFLSWFAYNVNFNSFLKNLDQQLFLAFPILIVIGLYWVRWWAIRPPRTWLDHISQTGA